MKLADVTIREGGQMPGRSYTADQKVEAGLALDSLGVEYVQAGFAVTGERDAEAIDRLARECGADVVSIARALERDVEAALEANADVVEVFAPVRDAQLEHTVGRSRTEMYASIHEAVDGVLEAGVEAHLTIVDAFRTELDHLVTAFCEFDGVGCITLADTVGAMTPQAARAHFEALESAGVDLSRAGAHFHDDLGLATANALAAYEAGVGKLDASVSALGERAGNASLEQVIVAGSIGYDQPFGVDASRLIPVCERVLSALDENVDSRNPILGEEVTTHESGIHTAAMLSDPSVMEPYAPERFGGSRTLLFGEKTGRGGARKLLERAGRDPTDGAIRALLDALELEGPLETRAAIDLAGRIEGVTDD